MSTTHAPEPAVADAASTGPVSATGLYGAVSVEGGLVTIRKGLVRRNTACALQHSRAAPDVPMSPRPRTGC